jgi:hypothetical protein
MLSNQELSPRVDIHENFIHSEGILLKEISSMRASIPAVMVNSPLKANSRSLRSVLTCLMRVLISSHS